jgi:hypothetical protein
MTEKENWQKLRARLESEIIDNQKEADNERKSIYRAASYAAVANVQKRVLVWMDEFERGIK